jgi:hypothetical protein
VAGHAGPSRRLPFRGAEEPRSRPALLGSEVLALFVVPTALLAQFGAAVLVTALANRRRGVRELLHRVFRWRVHPGWYLVAVLGLPVLAVPGGHRGARARLAPVPSGVSGSWAGVLDRAGVRAAEQFVGGGRVDGVRAGSAAESARSAGRADPGPVHSGLSGSPTNLITHPLLVISAGGSSRAVDPAWFPRLDAGCLGIGPA